VNFATISERRDSNLTHQQLRFHLRLLYSKLQIWQLTFVNKNNIIQQLDLHRHHHPAGPAARVGVFSVSVGMAGDTTDLLYLASCGSGRKVTKDTLQLAGAVGSHSVCK
jgi:hypothetical protein